MTQCNTIGAQQQDASIVIDVLEVVITVLLSSSTKKKTCIIIISVSWFLKSLSEKVSPFLVSS